MMFTTAQNIRLGFLACASGLITQKEFLGAVAAWDEGRQPLLGDVLLGQELIDIASLQSLVQLVEGQEGGPSEESIAETLRHLPGGHELAILHEKLSEEDPDKTLHFGGDFSTRLPERPAGIDSISLPIDQRFLNLRIHARGGLGEIWLAEDRALKRQVALKQIRHEHADHRESRARFVQEAEITGRLEHPGIVPIYALGEYADGRPYYAMRFIRGQSLELEIQQHHQARQSKTLDPGAPTLRQLLTRFIDVCEAVAYAHSRGVLHRDLKPENIMLGLYGETLVVDWGLAKVEGQQLQASDSLSPESPLGLTSGTPTRLGSALGTPGYMSPEQAQGAIDKLSPATDIYSLGATLYCLLTGRAPIQGESFTDILEDTCWGKFPTPRSLVSDIPRPLESICLQALRLEPGDRYATALELAADVQHFLDDEPVEAHLDSGAERASRWIRQHKTGVIACAALLVMIAIASLISSAVIAQSRNLALSLAEENSLLATEERQSRQAAQRLQKKAEAATVTARKQQARAEKYYGLAINTVDRFLTNVAQDDRLKAYGLENLRRDLLVQAADFYELVIQQADETEDPLHAQRANTHQRLAGLQFEVGNYEKAIDAYRKGLEQLAALPEEDDRVESESIVLLNDMGLALDAAGETNQAIENWRTLTSKISGLLLAKPDHPAYHGLLATVQLNLANKLELRAPSESMALSFQAKQHARRAIELQPEESGYRDTLALIHNNLAKTFIQQERFAEGGEELQVAESIWQERAAHAEGWVADFYANRLALVHLNQAAIAAQRGDTDAATGRLQQALDIRQRTAKLHPDSVQLQILLAQLHRSAANHYRTLIRYNESLQQANAALEISQHFHRQHPEVLEYRRDSALALIEQGLTQLAIGNRSEAKHSMQEAIDITTSSGQEASAQGDFQRPRALSRYYLGLVLADSAQAEQAADLLRLAAEEMASFVGILEDDIDCIAPLVDCQTTLGTLYGPEILDQETESQKWWSAALATCERLLDKAFASRLPPSVLTKIHMRRAESLTGKRQYDQALFAWEQVLANSDGDLDYELSSGKATTLFRAGRYGESLDLAKATALRLKHPPLVYALARQISLGLPVLATADLPAGERAKWIDSYSTTSIQILARAHRLGYFFNKQSRAFLQEDSYLDPLRDRKDFQSFLEKAGQDRPK